MSPVMHTDALEPPARLLFVADLFPFPLDRGQNVRVYNLIKACAQVYEVTFLGPRPARAEDAAPLQRLCRRLEYLPSPEDIRPQLRTWCVALGAAPGIRRPRRVREYLRFASALQALDPGSYDLIWAERLAVARLFRGALASRTLVDLDDLEHVKMSRRLRLGLRPAALLLQLYRLMIHRNAELRLSRRFRAAVVCSQTDRDYLAGRGCANVVVIPNGAAPSAAPLRRGPAPCARPVRTVFLGNLGYAPNVDAVEHYVNEVLPLLQAQIGDARFDVIGPGADDALRQQLAGKARFLGYVDDLAQALAQRDVFVAPLRYGAGTKLKVLEAMAHGIPVVTSSIGAEGLCVEHGRHALIADTPAVFARSVARLHADPAFARRLADAAYEHVVSRFSWEVIRRQAAQLLRGLRPPVQAPLQSLGGAGAALPPPN